MKRKCHVKTEKHREKTNVTTEVEIRVMQLQTKKCQELQPPPEARKR